MKRLRILALSLILTVIAGPIVFASDITGSKFFANILISNNGTYTTNVSVPVTSLNATILINGLYANDTVNNTALRNTSGADLAFMPGYDPLLNPWIVWVPAITADGYLTELLYLADAIGGKLRYFPGAAGMLTSDNAALEFGDNFSYKTAGFFDATVADNIFDKPQAISISGDGAGNIGAVLPASDPIQITPSGYAAWVEADLSGNIPGNATGAVIQVVSEDKDCGFRKNGSTDARIYQTYHTYVMIGVDTNGVCEIYIEDNTVDLYLIGYTDASWTFKTDADDVSVGPGAWTNIDVTAITSVDCVGVVIEIVNTDVGARQGAVRNDGSGDARTKPLNPDSHFWFVVGVDVATEIFEGFVNNANVELYLVGYVTAGATFKVNAVNKAIGAGVWTDIDSSVAAPGATFLFFEASQTAGADNTFGFRPNGSAFAVTGIVNLEKANAVVPCDAGQITEGFVNGANLDFFLQGYATTGIYPAGVGVSVAVATGERTIELNADGVDLELMVDRGELTEVSDTTAFAGSVQDNGNDLTSFVNFITPYIEYQEIIIGGNQRQFVEWTYTVNFSDQSGNGQDAAPSFRTASSDPNVSAYMSGFAPVSEAKAPPYVLGPTNPFLSDTSGNVTGEFTIVPPVGGFPLAGVIVAISGATSTPAQLPLLIIACFAIIAASLTTSYTLRKYGSGSILVKSLVIICFLGIFIGLKNFGIDFWMLISFAIFATGLSMMSRQQGWN